MNVILYQIINRELANPRTITIPDDTRDFDAWLHDNGYGGGGYTIRRGIVMSVTNEERRALHAEAARLKREGKLPSAASRIVGRLTKG